MKIVDDPDALLSFDDYPAEHIGVSLIGNPRKLQALSGSACSVRLGAWTSCNRAMFGAVRWVWRRRRGEVLAPN